MTAHSLLSSRRAWLKAAGGVAAGAALGGLGLPPSRAQAQGTATIYPIDGWLAAQGQSSGQVPPSKNFIDWTNREVALHHAPTPTPLVATIDYAGFEDKAFNYQFGTKIDKTNSLAMVQPLTDGSGNVSVRVQLYTNDANTWVIPLTLTFDANGNLQPPFNTQLVQNQVLFGFRPYPDSSVPLFGVCLGDSFLDITYIAPPYPNCWIDLETLLPPAPGLQRVAFRAQATGPLTPTYCDLHGLPRGTQGQCTVSETGLLALAPSTNSHSRVYLDGFPAEMIDLHPLSQ
jgi:hypothetical protein